MARATYWRSVFDSGDAGAGARHAAAAHEMATMAQTPAQATRRMGPRYHSARRGWRTARGVRIGGYGSKPAGARTFKTSPSSS